LRILPVRSLGWNSLARQYLLVLDRPLDSLNRVLAVDEDFTHPFRLTALVGLRQCIRNVATLFYLTAGLACAAAASVKILR
jgi:hypothetical protein